MNEHTHTLSLSLEFKASSTVEWSRNNMMQIYTKQSMQLVQPQFEPQYKW